jgi:hypothetical protein
MTASNQVPVDVSVEAIIHNSLSKFVQEINNQYGVMIERASIEWLDVSSLNEPRAIVKLVRLETLTAPGR